MARVSFPTPDQLSRLIGQPWDMQAWDTPKSFAYFTDYYLALPKERRNLVEAFRAFQISRGQKKDKKIIQASGIWRCYHDGLNAAGNRPPGSAFEHSLTWPQRAMLRDIYLHKRTQEALAQEIEEFKRAEVQMGKALLDRARQMLVSPLFLRETSEDGKTIWIKPAAWKESDIPATATAGSKLARLGLDLETENVTITDWRQKLVTSGIDPDQFLSTILSAMVAADRSGPESDSD